MSNIKKPKTMTPKGFLHKTTTRAANSAGSFLKAHRDFLTTGELALLTSPILRKVDDGTLMPTPGLQEIATVVMSHIIAVEAAKAEAAMFAPEAGKTTASKAWVATIYDAAGNICTRIKDDGEEESLVKSFDMGQECDRWADRRLFEGASDWYAEVVNAKAKLSNRVERADAIARVLKKAPGPVIHQKKQSTPRLGFGVKAKQDRSCFSRG